MTTPNDAAEPRQEPQPEGEPGRRRRLPPRWAPVLVAVAVIAVVAGVVAVVRGGGSSGGSGGGQPPALTLAGLSNSKVAAAAGTVSGPVELDGTLPSGGPSHGRVHRYQTGKATKATVTKLATALGITATPTRSTTGWQAKTGDRALTVSDRSGQRWTAAGVTPGGDSCVTVGADNASSTSCSSLAGASPAPTASGSPPSVTAARTAAAPVFRALGLDPAAVTAQAAGNVMRLSVAPRVDGLPVSGADTTVAVTGDGTITWASGLLAGQSAGDSYPLLTAKQAFDRLRTSGPKPALACAANPASGDCPSPAATVVTGAKAGLLLATTADGTTLLVPAWLFTVKGSSSVLAEPALPSRFLVTPGGTRTLPSAAATTALPGSVAPVPASPAPAPTGTAVATPSGATYPIVTVQAPAGSTTVTVRYEPGGQGGNPCTLPAAVTVVAESPKLVLVAKAVPRQPGMNCPMYVVDGPLPVTVKLAAPVGDRAVVDGSTGKSVPVTR